MEIIIASLFLGGLLLFLSSFFIDNFSLGLIGGTIILTDSFTFYHYSTTLGLIGTLLGILILSISSIKVVQFLKGY